MNPVVWRIDAFVVACLVPLASAILFSGLDDLVVDVVWFAGWLKRKRTASHEAEITVDLPDKRIAIFVPLWKEHAVIRGMLEHNISALKYSHYDFFIGAYPNDDRTLDAVREMEEHHARVHLAVCPHDGPTSKADCLNWIYQRMLLHEEQHGVQYDIVVTHNAEDLIHPDSLRVLNDNSARFDMVQIPVLALPTPL